LILHPNQYCHLHVQINDSDSLDLVDEFYISFWMKPNNLSTSQRYLLSKLTNAGTDNVYSVAWEYVNNTVEFYANYYTGDAPRTGSQIVVSDTAWHHIAYNYDGTNWQGYLDGEQVFSLTKSFTLSASEGKLLIGAFNANRIFEGWLDEVKIYDRGLTETEILADYNSFLSAKFVDNNIIDASASVDWNGVKINSDINYNFGSEIVSSESYFDENLVGLWHLNDDALDNSGNGNNGTWGGSEAYVSGLWSTNAGTFDGSTDYIGIDDSDSLSFDTAGQTMTLSTWIYTENTCSPSKYPCQFVPS